MTAEKDRLVTWGDGSEVRPMGRAEAWFSQSVGRALARLGKMAMKRGDVHEYRHAYAALLAGNSDPCQEGMCHLDLEA